MKNSGLARCAARENASRLALRKYWDIISMSFQSSPNLLLQDGETVRTIPEEHGPVTIRAGKETAMEADIAYCGVDCAACADYQSGVCPSCRQTDWEDDPCMPVRCCEEQGVSCCGECPGFPCTDMAAFYEESDSHRAAYARMRALRE